MTVDMGIGNSPCIIKIGTNGSDSEKLCKPFFFRSYIVDVLQLDLNSIRFLLLYFNTFIAPY